MPCYHPLKGFRAVGGGVSFSPRGGYVDLPLSVPCGQCIGCRLERSRQWAVRIMHEASLHDSNVFLTLTYDDVHLPYHGVLVKRDFQLFMKRLRREFSFRDDFNNLWHLPISFYHCGEYGDESDRPHYHAILFGVDFLDGVVYSRNGRDEPVFTSECLSKLWPAGLAVFGAVTFESAAYCARYCVKKVTGQQALFHYQRTDIETGEIFMLPPEYATMSLKPGIGKGWFDRYGAELEDNDSVVMRGHEMPVPRYYDKKRSKSVMKLVRKKRIRRLADHPGEGSERRLRVKEIVKRAQVNFLGRTL